MISDETGHMGKRRAEAAFTLTEVVIGALLMVLSLSMLISTFVSARRSVAITQSHLTARKIASSEAERLRTNLYSSIASATVTITNALMTYTLTRSVTTNALDTYKDVKITIVWTAPLSSKRQALTNYIAICNTN
jgi:flagellar basal body-associated protein FliL